MGGARGGSMRRGNGSLSEEDNERIASFWEPVAGGGQAGGPKVLCAICKRRQIQASHSTKQTIHTAQCLTALREAITGLGPDLPGFRDRLLVAIEGLADTPKQLQLAMMEAKSRLARSETEGGSAPSTAPSSPSPLPTPNPRLPARTGLGAQGHRQPDANVCSKERKAKIDEAIVEMIYKLNLPLGFAETDAFRNVCQLLCPAYVQQGPLPGRKRVSTTILDERCMKPKSSHSILNALS